MSAMRLTSRILAPARGPLPGTRAGPHPPQRPGRGLPWQTVFSILFQLFALAFAIWLLASRQLPTEGLSSLPVTTESAR
jgi:hypothetical protein